MSSAPAQNLQDRFEIPQETFSTRRAMSPDLEKVLYEPLPVLNHGFVRVIDYMGNDTAIVQAARVSYGAGTKKVSQDRGLIRYLMRHRHTTPFEMCEIKYHIKLPIFIARQWIRHRTANVNEYSARYSILGKDFYLPEPSQMAAQSNINNQGRGDTLSPEQSKEVLALLKKDAEQCYDNYEHMLNEDPDGNPRDDSRPGLARELARMNLTLNYYTEWYWKIDLHNLLHFLSLRADSHAQYEIRAYADVMLETVKRWCPIAYEAFEDYVQGSTKLSKTGREVVQRLIRGEKVTQENSGLNPREWRELAAELEL
ncbi:MAG: FAD-dependent thymidylate synthase [bacterium]|nr:FAD-dependent thymidylate synthase [bacterium]